MKIFIYLTLVVFPIVSIIVGLIIAVNFIKYVKNKRK